VTVLSEWIEFNPRVRLEKDKVYPFVSMDVIVPGKRFVSAAEERKFTGGGAKFCKGDTLFARITPCLENGKISQFVDERGADGAFGSTEFFVLRAISGKSTPEYVYYLSQTDLLREVAVKSMVGASGRQRADIKVIRDLELEPPPLEVQARVGTVLSAYDDLIETNQRRIVLLEEAAGRLYREWIVNLRFPGHEAVKVVNGLPEGWERTTLGELVDRTDGSVVQTGPFGSQLHRHEYVETGVPVVMPQDIVRDRVRNDRISFVNDTTARRLSRHELRPLDIVFPRRGDISKRALIEEHQAGFLCGTGCLKIRVDPDSLHPVLLYHQLADPDMVRWVEGQAVGTTMLNLSATILRSVTCIIPSSDVQEMFVNFANQVRSQMDVLELQNAALAQARDALLPKLMGDQLDVSDIPLPQPEAA